MAIVDPFDTPKEQPSSKSIVDPFETKPSAPATKEQAAPDSQFVEPFGAPSFAEGDKVQYSAIPKAMYYYGKETGQQLGQGMLKGPEAQALKAIFPERMAKVEEEGKKGLEATEKELKKLPPGEAALGLAIDPFMITKGISKIPAAAKALFGAPEKLAGKLIGGPTQPAITELAKKAEGMGFVLDPAQLRPAKPIGSPGFTTAAQLKNENIATKMVTKSTGAETNNITPEFLKKRTEQFAKDYEYIFNRNFEIDKPFVDTLRTIEQFERSVSPATSTAIVGTARNLIDRYEKEAILAKLKKMQQQQKRLGIKEGPLVGGLPQGMRRDWNVVYKAGDDQAPDWLNDVTNMVNELSGSMGLVKTPEVYAGIPRRSSLQGQASPIGVFVVRSDLDRNGAIATAIHEFGHQAEFQALRYAPMEVQSEIMKAYLSQAKTTPKGKLTTEQYRPITAEKYGKENREAIASGSYETYLRNFNEWFAEQTSRWITQTKAPATVVEKFFAGIADVWKKIYQRVVGYVPGVKEVDQFFRSRWSGDVLADAYPQKMFAELDTDLGNITGKISGKELQRLRSNLRDIANYNTDGSVRRAASEFVTQIDGMIARENPKLAEDLIRTNREYAATMTLAEGIEKGFVTQGKVSLEGLGNYLAGKTYGFGLGTSKHPLYEPGFLGQQLKIRSREEGTQYPASKYITGKARALSDLLGTTLGGRSQFARGIQRSASEPGIKTSAGIPLSAEEQATLQGLTNLGIFPAAGGQLEQKK